jgi:hypothetical protein
MGAEFEGTGQGFRWLTVGAPDQPDVEIILADCGMGHDPQTTGQLRELVAKGASAPGVPATDDCRKTYEELSARGVVFRRSLPNGRMASKPCFEMTRATRSAQHTEQAITIEPGDVAQHASVPPGRCADAELAASAPTASPATATVAPSRSKGSQPAVARSGSPNGLRVVTPIIAAAPTSKVRGNCREATPLAGIQ